MAEKKPGLDPLPVNGKSPEPSPAPEQATLALDTATERFMAENPEKPAPAEKPSSEPVATEPVVKPSEPETKVPPKPGVEPTKAEPVATEPGKPAVEQPVTKPTYAADEKIALAEGNEWTRAQIVTALQERETQRTQLAPLKAEAEGYKQLFGMPLAEAKEAWQPILETLARQPETAQLFESVLQNPAKAEYLQQCSAFFDKQPGNEAPAPAKPAVDPVMAQQVKELNEWRTAQMQREGTDAMNRDLATATQKYPMLATDKGLLQDLVLTSQALYSQAKAANFPNGNRPWLLDALALKASIYDALSIARTTQPTPQPEVGPILGTQGAEPNPTRTKQIKRKVFTDLNEAVEAFARDVPADRFS